MTAVVSSFINPSNPRCVVAAHQYNGEFVGSWSATASLEQSKSSSKTKTTSVEHLTPSPTTQSTAATRTYAITASPMLLLSHSPTVSQDNITVSKTILLEASSTLSMTHRHGRGDLSVTAAINGTTSFGPPTQTLAMSHKTESVSPSRTSSPTARGSIALLLRSPTVTNDSYVKSSTLLVNNDVAALTTSPSRINAKITTTSSAVAAAVSVAGLTATGLVAVRGSLMQQLAQCATDSSGTNSSLVATLIGTSNSNLFQINVGDPNDIGFGYRGALVSSIVLAVGAAVALTLVVAVKWWLQATHDIAELRHTAAHMDQPGWWLAGPFAIAAAPLFSSSLSLISTSIVVGTSASDAVLITASLVLFTVPFGMCFRALLRPAFGGWFTASTRGPTYDEEGVRGWIVGGGMRWVIDVRVASRDHAASSFLHAYGSLFASMRPHRHWWFLVDMSTSVVVALLAALPSLALHRDDTATLVPNLCTGALHASTAVQMLFMMAFVALRPVAVRWEHAAALLQVVLGALSALLTSLSAAGVDGLDDASNAVTIAQTVIMVVTLVGGLVDDGMSVLTGRPTRRARLLVFDIRKWESRRLISSLSHSLERASASTGNELRLLAQQHIVELSFLNNLGTNASTFDIALLYAAKSDGDAGRALEYLIYCITRHSHPDASLLSETYFTTKRAP